MRGRYCAVALCARRGHGEELNVNHAQCQQTIQRRARPLIHGGLEQRNLRHVGQGQRFGASEQRLGQGVVAHAVQSSIQRGLVQGVGQGQMIQPGAAMASSSRLQRQIGGAAADAADQPGAGGGLHTGDRPAGVGRGRHTEGDVGDASLPQPRQQRLDLNSGQLGAGRPRWGR